MIVKISVIMMMKIMYSMMDSTIMMYIYTHILYIILTEYSAHAKASTTAPAVGGATTTASRAPSLWMFIPCCDIYNLSLIHVVTLINKYIYIYTYIQYVLTYVRAYIHTYIHTYMHTYIHTCMHAYIIVTCFLSFLLTCLLTCLDTYKYSNHIYIYIYTNRRTLFQL